MQAIGDKEIIAFEVGENWDSSPHHQHIGIWLSGRKLNPIDDVVYLPTFRGKLASEIDRLTNNAFRVDDCEDDRDAIYRRVSENLDHQILNYDVSICVANTFFLEVGDRGKVLFSFWDERHDPSDEIGIVFEADVDKATIVKALNQLATQIEGSHGG